LGDFVFLFFSLKLSMASHLDLEEQEQIEELKHFWRRYGPMLTWALIAVLGAYSAWTGWQYWQRRQGVQASVLYATLEGAVGTADQALVSRALSDMQDKFGATTYAAHASLLAAHFFLDHNAPLDAQRALTWTLAHSPDEGLGCVAKLRLAAVSMDTNDWAGARSVLGGHCPASFEALVQDRLGDIDVLEKKPDDASTHYLAAWRAMKDREPYRQLVEVKLASLGVDPRQEEKKP
jgi:predicted negative regulator of RcsB-dependent stress response